MQLKEWHFPDELRYDRHHQWIRREGPEMVVGINDYLNATAGDFLYLHLPGTGQRVERDEALASVESGKWVGRIYAPASGVVVAVNDNLTARPALLNEDPYGEGWLIRLRPDDPQAFESLLESKEYGSFLERELAAEGS